MPRKAKIVAVPVDVPVEQPVEEAAAPEDKTDAEEMTNVINEIKTEDEPVAEPVTEPVDEPVVEPKPKRAPRAKAPARKKVKEPEPEVVAVEPTLEESTVEVTAPEEKPAPVVKDKVACPDCGKEMSAKTLKYSHVPNCMAKKQKADEEPTINEELIEEIVQKRWDNVTSNLRRERLERKQAAMERLISRAF